MPKNILDIDCSNNNITDITSLEGFRLRELNCIGNRITKVKNMAIDTLFCGKDMSGSNLFCNYSTIENIGGNTKMKNCSFNKIEEYENGLMIDFSNIFIYKKFITSSDFIKVIKNQSLDISKIIWVIISGTNIEKIETLVIFKNLKYLDCSHNKLYLLPEMPRSILEIDCSNNNITDLPLLDNRYLKRLNCVNNKIKEIKNMIVDILYCSNNNITTLECQPKVLCCDNNNIRNINNIGSHIKILDCSYNKVKDFDFTKCSFLEEVYVNNNMINTVENLPASVKVLHINNNIITTIPYFKGLETLYCDNKDSIKLSTKYDISNYKIDDKFIVFEF